MRAGASPAPTDRVECVYWFNEKGNETDTEEDIDNESRIICWFEVEKKTFLGAIYYPYDIVECYYLPFYIKNKKVSSLF